MFYDAFSNGLLGTALISVHHCGIIFDRSALLHYTCTPLRPLPSTDSFTTLYGPWSLDAVTDIKLEDAASAVSPGTKRNLHIQVSG